MKILVRNWCSVWPHLPHLPHRPQWHNQLHRTEAHYTEVFTSHVRRWSPFENFHISTIENSKFKEVKLVTTHQTSPSVMCADKSMNPRGLYWLRNSQSCAEYNQTRHFIHQQDMLMNKEDLTVTELQVFLQSHLRKKNCTELFQELMCTKQNDNETPQQFLYRVIGLKQRILFTSNLPDASIKYSRATVQDVFLHTVYQGLGHRYNDIRRELKTLLVVKKM